MRLRDTLNDAAARLALVSDTPRLDAELLMAHALGVSREALVLKHLEDAAPDGFEPLLNRRLAQEPLAYITGTRDFWTISLNVASGVLIPRPDSETLIEAAVAHFGDAGPATVLDLGTGSGALLLAALAEWPNATGLGIDKSRNALKIAQDNAERLGLADRATFALGDWGNEIVDRFHLILCNPPYVETGAELAQQVVDHEPPTALYAGADGMDAYRRLIPQLPSLIVPGGLIVVEIGSTQSQPVSKLFRQAGLEPETRKDLGQRDRAILHFALGIGE